MTTTVNLNKVNFMSESRFDEMGTTDNAELYMVENTVKICEVVFSGLAANQYYTQNLPVPLPDDLSKVFCNIYAKVVGAIGNFSVGDIIPFSSLWGNNYRPLNAWYNSTQCGLSTSNQIYTNNKNVADTGIVVLSAIEIHFEFYKME